MFILTILDGKLSKYIAILVNFPNILPFFTDFVHKITANFIQITHKIFQKVCRCHMTINRSYDIQKSYDFQVTCSVRSQNPETGISGRIALFLWPVNRHFGFKGLKKINFPKIREQRPISFKALMTKHEYPCHF